MLLGFKRRFVSAILSGSKCHTIRAKRTRPPRVGETLHCYTGLRQKGATLLGLTARNCGRIARTGTRQLPRCAQIRTPAGLSLPP